MDTKQATTLFEALSSPVRVSVFRLLVKHGEEGLVAGDIAAQLNIAPTNLSFHLKHLVHSQLVSVEQEGRFMRYKANISLMLDVIAYLTEECCAGNPDKCLEYRKNSRVDESIFTACATKTKK